MDIQIERIDSGGPKLRIAVVTETYPPEINGVALSLSRLVRALAQRQHSIQLIRVRQPVDPLPQRSARIVRPAPGSPMGFDTRDQGQDVLMRGIPIPRYPGLRMGLPCKGDLVRIWSHQRPDVVHIATEGPLGWSALRAARQLKLPVSSEFRTNFHAYSHHYGLGMLTRSIMMVLRKFHNAADLTMVPTAALRDELADSGFRNLAVVGRGVELADFNPNWRSEELRRQWGLAQDALAVVCLGRLAAEKNLMLAVRAFEEMRRVQPLARMVFIGDGPLREALQQRCPDAIFTGMLRGPALSAALASADLFLFPSETETFGNVVIEAMASGLPVLAYRMAAAAAVIRNDESGWTVAPGDEDAFVSAAVSVVSDRDLLSGVGTRAAAVAGGLDWRRIAQQVEENLVDLIDRTRISAGPDRAAFSGPSWVGRS